MLKNICQLVTDFVAQFSLVDFEGTRKILIVMQVFHITGELQWKTTLRIYC